MDWSDEEGKILPDFVKRNPEVSGNDVWNSLHELDGIQPSEQDLSDHVSLLCEAMKRDECLRSFLEKTAETEPIDAEQDAEISKEHNFLDDYRTDEESNSDDNSETNLQFDPVCSICDNGGYVLCCEGSCLRSFHPTIDAGSVTDCESLGFIDEKQVQAITSYLCNNCLYKQHQCFACGQLGSSDENSSQEVFPCSASNCGHFYHPKCVAKLLSAGDQIKSEELQVKIASRESFCCPLHICKVCNLSENKNLYAMHFAVCRRCPTAYHRKCLPREITSNDETLQRAWENLLPYNRILIYCLDHEIEGDLSTPARDHLIFPDISGPRSHGLAQLEEDVSSRVTEEKPHGSLFAHLSTDASKKSFCEMEDYVIKQKMDSTVEKVAREDGPSASAGEDKADEDLEKRMMSIIDEVNSTFDMDEYIKSLGVNQVKSYHSGNDIGKNITLGLVETHVKAARTALKMFEEGRDEEARAIFDPDILPQLMKHKRQLEIYLSPFLHGKRYTSYGRHFTQPTKLEEIVERLHWYVKNGDMVVDFCCGSNDFSCIMKEQLVKTGKQCSFKNFDLIPAKNSFNFEKRDWMTVEGDELPDGSKLIMGLNPPFGYKASLANSFIKKALEFKPKILILIVPSETKRVNEIANYELIWKDSNLLAGKSFYLPGSIDVNDKAIEQWNNIPPPLYLWSRKEWSKSHKAIALQQGHIRHMDRSIFNEDFHRSADTVLRERHRSREKTPYRREQRFVEFNDVRGTSLARHEMDGKSMFSRPSGFKRKLFPASRVNKGLFFEHHFPPPLTHHHHLRLPSPPRQSRRTKDNTRRNENQRYEEQEKKRSNEHVKKNVSDGCLIINEDSISGESSGGRDGRTTVMIKNIPNKYSQKLLLELLDSHCNDCNQKIIDEGNNAPVSSYDFVYLPMDFSNKCNVGYGFVNMTSPEALWRLYKALHNQQWGVFKSTKICEVTYARIQGVESLKEHFKRSRLPGEEMEMYMPVIFSPPRDGRLLTEPIAVADLGTKADSCHSGEDISVVRVRPTRRWRKEVMVRDSKRRRCG